mmetsp:Transcript_50656/g.108182  ORF Transcript_50656/g.108182 Transcript_50656/m.108182 type:complete len:279 (-) Transcript_50656:145-981(-)
MFAMVMASLGFWVGKGVLLTGASSGLGEELALELSRRGASVVLAARRTDRLDQTADRCKACNPDAPKPAVLHLDLGADTATLTAKATEAAALLDRGEIDVLLCCAGVGQRSAAIGTPAEAHARIMAQFEGHVALTRAVLPSMLERRSGSIGVVSSVQGFFGQPYRSSYAAAKSALIGYYDSLRAEVASSGVRVTVIAPGYIATGHSASAIGGDGAADANALKGMSPAELATTTCEAVQSGAAEVIAAPLYARVAIAWRVLWPASFFAYMQAKAAKGPS